MIHSIEHRDGNENGDTGDDVGERLAPAGDVPFVVERERCLG
jgi:hypothetical protein